jgi:alanine racemase
MLHICNTSGLINFPEAHYDMVRSGIGFYGFSGNPKIKLSPVHRLKSVISQIHTINKNESVGYNRSHFSQENEKIATIPIGHADGITRIFGNKKGFVFINEQKAFIVGNVCMDVIMVDVSNIKCKEGDQVIIFNEVHTAEDLCCSAGTISYELISSISTNRITRSIIE